MNLEMLCNKLEIDMEKALARFAGNQMLYVRFLKKLNEDPTFEGLKYSVEQRKMEDVEKDAHTLKGVAFNLGLDRLGLCADQIVQAVRRGEFSRVDELFLECEKEYENIKKGLMELE